MPIHESPHMMLHMANLRWSGSLQMLCCPLQQMTLCRSFFASECSLSKASLTFTCVSWFLLAGSHISVQSDKWQRMNIKSTWNDMIQIWNILYFNIWITSVDKLNTVPRFKVQWFTNKLNWFLTWAFLLLLYIMNFFWITFKNLTHTQNTYKYSNTLLGLNKKLFVLRPEKQVWLQKKQSWYDRNWHQ